MKRVMILASLALAVPVHADPHPCQVHVARAPAAIRAEIERWLAGESSCNVALEVRVVPTEGGYYLLARDVRGRVRERIVPDGASAGVLVASWASDDQMGVDEPAPTGPRPAGLDGDDDDDGASGSDRVDEPVAAEPAPPSSVAPSAIVATRATVVPAIEPGPFPSKWLRVDILAGLAGVAGSGLRAEVDVWQRHGWSIGIASSLDVGSYWLPTVSLDDMTGIDETNIDAAAYVARTVDITSWLHVRGSLALGTQLTYATVPYVFDYGTATDSITRLRAFGSASLLAGAELGHGWAVEVGLLAPVVSGMSGTLQTSVNTFVVQLNAAAGLQFFGGLAHRL
jgi:hypothetical protein